MNRMLFLRDIENDVLIRCRACGHEGVLPRAEAERRFGPSYPVLSIAPHFRCSACNARAAESCAAPLSEEPQVSHVARPEDDDDSGFAATLAALQGLVEAAHAPPPIPRRAAPPPPPPDDEEDEDDDGPPAWASGWAIADRDPPPAAFEPEPDPEPEPEAEDETPPEPSPWDAITDDAITDTEEDAPAWTPPAPKPRPALPSRPFFASRERRETTGDEAAPLSLAQIQALLADDDAGPSLAEMVAAEAPPPVPDDEGAPEEDAFPEDAPLDDGNEDADVGEDEDDPLLSSALQRLLRHPPAAEDDADAGTGGDIDSGTDAGWGADWSAGQDGDAPARPAPLDDDDRWSPPMDMDDGWPIPEPEPSPETPDAPATDDATDDATDAHDVIAAALRAGGAEEEPELSDEELIAFAIGDRDEHHDLSELPPELAALLAAGDPLAADLDDEDEVYEYQPGEILSDEPGDEGEPVIPRELIDAITPAAAAPEPELEPEPEPELEPEPAPAPPPRMLDHDDDLADFPDPPAWKTQRPPPSADDEGGMEDALSTLRALIEQAAAEPEPEAEAEAEPPAATDDDAITADVFAPAAPTPRPSPLDDDDDLSWEALMREVAAKAGEPADDAAGETIDEAVHETAAAMDDAPPEPPAAATPPAARSGGSLSDTLSRLRGLLDLPAGEEAPRPPPKKRR